MQTFAVTFALKKNFKLDLSMKELLVQSKEIHHENFKDQNKNPVYLFLGKV